MKEPQRRNCTLVDNKYVLSLTLMRKRMVTRQKTDRRVDAKASRDALHSLIHERDYDSIVIKEIRDRANVGRSAFYMQFRDKDELLVSAFHDILGVVLSARRPSVRA